MNKISAKKVNYDFYFYNNQNMFVVKSQMQYIDLTKIKKSHQLMDDMKNHKHFIGLIKEFQQEKEFKDKTTLVIDIENVLLREINLEDPEELKALEQAYSDNYREYLLVDQSVEFSSVIKHVNDPQLSDTYLWQHKYKINCLIKNYRSKFMEAGIDSD